MKLKYWQRFTLATLFCIISSVGTLALVLHFCSPMINETPQEKCAEQKIKDRDRNLQDFAIQTYASYFNLSQSNWIMTITRRTEK